MRLWRRVRQPDDGGLDALAGRHLVVFVKTAYRATFASVAR
jgi:hypothetical protein